MYLDAKEFARFSMVKISNNEVSFPLVKLVVVASKDENIGNHRYIGTSILRIYWIYRQIF